MITVNAITAKQLALYKDVCVLSDEVRCVITKAELGLSKTFSFSDIDEFDYFYVFLFGDVVTADEDLPLGLVAISDSAPGEWRLEIQTKSTIATEWTVAYADLLYSNKTVTYPSV